MNLWFSFAIGFLILGLFLTLPGFLFAKALNFKTIESLCISSSISICLYEVLSIIFGLLNIYTQWQILFLPCVFAGALSLIVKRIVQNKELLDSTPRRATRIKSIPARTSQYFSMRLKQRLPWIFILYILCGMFFIGICIIVNLGSPAAFSSVYDNYFHINLPAVYVESGDWSTFHVGLYIDNPEYEVPLLPNAEYGYYPAAQHMLVAFISNALSLPIALGINIVNCYFVSIVFSSGLFLLSMTLFKKETVLIALGAFAAYAFASFPYIAYTTNFVPYLCSVCLIPASIFLIIYTFRIFIINKKACVTSLFALIICCASIGFMHPSSFFAILFVIIIYSISQIIRNKTLSTHLKIISSGCILVALFMILIAFTHSSMGEAMAWHINSAVIPIQTSIFHLLTFSFIAGKPQYLLAILVVAGLIFASLHKQFRWLAAVYAVFSIVFIIAGSAENNSFLKTIFTVYWYGKTDRISFVIIVCVIPLLMLGLKVVISFINQTVKRINRRHVLNTILFAILSLSFVLTPLLPYFKNSFLDFSNTPFGYAETVIRNTYQGATDTETAFHVYNLEEQAFVKKAMDTIEKNAVVANVPSDGSFLAYGISGLNTYSRTFGGALPTDTWKIMGSLDQYVSNPDINSAVKAAGIKYVIQLDAGQYESEDAQVFLASKFAGITSIDEQTEGFELIMSDGNMKLFKLTEI